MDTSLDSDPLPYWTIKIAGVPGSGKTTLLIAIENAQQFECSTITYSKLLRKFGTKELADQEVNRILKRSNGLVLMDDHLEFENNQRSYNYKKENTAGLILLNPPIKDILLRIDQDISRHRCKDIMQIEEDLKISYNRAMQLVAETGIDLLVLDNFNGDIDNTIDKSLEFIRRLH